MLDTGWTRTPKPVSLPSQASGDYLRAFASTVRLVMVRSTLAVLLAEVF